MAYQGEHAVMSGRVHSNDARAGQFPGRGHQLERTRGSFRYRRQNQVAFREQFGKRRRRAAFFGAGYRVRRHKSWKCRAQLAPRPVDHIALGAAGIAHHRVRCEVGRNLREHRAGLAQRHRQQYEVRVLHCARRISGDFVDDAQPARCKQIRAASANANHMRDRAAFFKRQGERPTDQSDAEDDQLTDQRLDSACARFFCRFFFHAASDWPSASRKRAFSDSRPMLTRK